MGNTEISRPVAGRADHRGRLCQREHRGADHEEVCHNNTGHAETVRVEYDAQQLPLARLLKFYFASISPTSLNRQGEDSGSQYRTGIYYVDAADEEVIREALRELSTHYQQPVMVECCRLRNYYPAEEYHQKYLEKNPTGYCHLDPALFDAAYDLPEKNRKKNNPVDIPKVKAVRKWAADLFLAGWMKQNLDGTIK